jgi:excisionase family DNA binding protein
MRNTAQVRNDQLLTTAQVAERLGLSVATVNRRAKDGELRPEMEFPGRTGARLFHPAEVERFAATIGASS